MILSNLFLAAIVLLIGGTVIFAVVSAVRTYLTNLGSRLVTCPETKSPAAVQLNAARCGVRQTPASLGTVFPLA